MDNIISQKVSITPFGDLIDLMLLPVISTLTNFTNITLSSLYFDITKDNLYANKTSSTERRSTVTVLQHVRRDRELRVL
jgi:isoleucyl-tRNA synthetase